MNRVCRHLLSRLASLGVALGVAGCATPPRAVSVADHGRNAIAQWDEIATTTLNLPPAASGTPEERRPVYNLDLATLHVAIYDAAMAIAGTHQPFSARPASSAGLAGASQEAAVHAAAYTVLKGLFPQRAASYQAAYDNAVASLPADAASQRGLQVGAEIAVQVLARRADDGRWASPPVYVPGSEDGAFRGSNPVNRFLPLVRPFALASAAQFRPGAPPALGSPAYLADLTETRARGGTVSAQRSAQQVESARFHSEPPFRFWPRNFRTFATSQPSLAENARLMAMLWVGQADGLIACFEAKYHFNAWRPLTAIAQTDTAWAPLLPTPNHPEYPAAHSCASNAVAATLQAFYGTRAVAFRFDSVATQTTHAWPNVDAFAEEIRLARIDGGMHFRSAMLAGDQLGASVVRWIASRHFASTR